MQRKQDISSTPQLQAAEQEKALKIEGRGVLDATGGYAMSATPNLDGNIDIFNATYKLVCARAEESSLPIEAILCQVIYHAAYEIILGGDLTMDLITGVVEAAAVQVARTIEAGDAEGGDQ